MSPRAHAHGWTINLYRMWKSFCFVVKLLLISPSYWLVEEMSIPGFWYQWLR